MNDSEGFFSFRVATKEQRLLLVKTLLASGSRVGSSEGLWSECPLYLATKYLGYRGRHQLAVLLLAAGTDPTVLDSKGRSSLYWSLRNQDYDLFTLMVDAHNPRCWDALLQPRAEALIAQLPEKEVMFVKDQLYTPPSLMRHCRLAIRQHLLNFSGYKSLYTTIPLTPLPERLRKFLLYNIELPEEDEIPCFMKDLNHATLR